MKLNFNIFCFILLLVSFTVCGQDPMFYSIGKNKLSDVDVYSMLEDDNGRLFISSDNGLYRYENGTFFHYPLNPLQKKSSLFFLVKSVDNRIFCSNLKGQIFEAKKNQLNLFYTIPEKDLITIPKIFADNHGNLIVKSKKISIISSDGKMTKEISDFRFVEKTSQGEIVVGLPQDELYFLNKNKSRTFSIKKYKNEAVRVTILKNATLSSPDQFNSPKINVVPENYFYSVFHIEKEQFLVRLRGGGIQELLFENDSIKARNTFFKNTFISAFCKGSKNLYFWYVQGRN